MYILLLAEVIVLCILYLASRGKYPLPPGCGLQKNDGLKPFIPAGLKFMELIRYDCRTAYDVRLEAKLYELNGPANLHSQLKVHNARKIVITYFCLVFTTFVGTQVQPDAAYAVFGLVIAGAVFIAVDKQLERRVKERRRDIQIDFPEFLNKLILLVNAGQTVSMAVQKIVREGKRERALYKELAVVINEMALGKSELEAYEDFARRCRLQEASAFAAALVQNMRKGNDELVPILRMQALHSWENRKNIARKLGEEASTKLLLPMMISFIAILIMVMAPAVMQLNF